ncbi:MAG: ATP-binding protein [Proteobacteria bacterium]|nr:ATP-binding protein [Pseudomonadota bacterium]
MVSKELAPVFKVKNVAFLHNTPDFSNKVTIDKDKIIQVIQNLLSNAVEYSYPGGKVVVDIAQKEEHLLLSVHDYGVGIPEDELDTIFDKFVQSSQTKTGAGGTGAGPGYQQGDHHRLSGKNLGRKRSRRRLRFQGSDSLEYRRKQQSVPGKKSKILNQVGYENEKNHRGYPFRWKIGGTRGVSSIRQKRHPGHRQGEIRTGVDRHR